MRTPTGLRSLAIAGVVQLALVAGLLAPSRAGAYGCGGSCGPPPPSCVTKARPSTPQNGVKGEALRGLYRLGDRGSKIAPTGTPSGNPDKFAALGGVYANILNCSPWVEPGSDPGTSAWVMLQQVGTSHTYIQIGWIEDPNGPRTTLVAFNDPVTQAQATINTIINAVQGSNLNSKIEERCDDPHSLKFLSCTNPIAAPPPDTSTYYTIEYHPASPAKQTYTEGFDVLGGEGILTFAKALSSEPVQDTLKQTDTKVTISPSPPLQLPPTWHVTFTTPFTSRGSFAVFMQQPSQARVQVATAPARFIPNQANVAGEIHNPYSQMPGDASNPEVFGDVHVYSDGGWVGFGGQELLNNGKTFDSSGCADQSSPSCTNPWWKLTASPNDPMGAAGQLIQLWDTRVP